MNKEFKLYGELINKTENNDKLYQYKGRCYIVKDLHNSNDVNYDFTRLHYQLMRDWFTIFNKTIDLEVYSDEDELIISMSTITTSDLLTMLFMTESAKIIDEVLGELVPPYPEDYHKMTLDKIYSRTIETACSLAVEYENK